MRNSQTLCSTWALDDRFQVREHGALGAPCGAGGVEEARQIVVGARHCHVRCRLLAGKIDEGAGAIGLHAREGGHLVGGRSFLDLRELRLGHDNDGGLGVADEILELGRHVGGVERIVDGAGLERRQIEHDVLDRLLDLHHDAVARLDAELDERVGHAADIVAERLVGDGTSAGHDECGAVARGAEARLQQSVEAVVIGHWRGAPAIQRRDADRLADDARR